MCTTCVRCGGRMVETFVEGEVVFRNDPAGIWKCVNCGEVIDSQILANRRLGRYSRIQPSLAPQSSLPVSRAGDMTIGNGWNARS